jgi:hypothetical protein
VYKNLAIRWATPEASFKSDVSMEVSEGVVQRIHEIDRKLTRVFANFATIASELEFERVCRLGSRGGLDSLDCPGIYLIEIHSGSTQTDLKDWLATLKSTWDREEFRQCFVPTCKIGRMNAHSELQRWMPLYIGKSKRMKHRIEEHIDLPLAARTFALKLRERRLFESNKFQLKVLRLPVSNYDVIAPKLESALRKRFNPIVGKQ